MGEVVGFLGLPPPRGFGRSCDTGGAGAGPEKCHHEGLLGAGSPAPQEPSRARIDAEPCGGQEREWVCPQIELVWLKQRLKTEGILQQELRFRHPKGLEPPEDPVPPPDGRTGLFKG